MKKLCEEHRSAVLDYLMKEPEFNLFFIGDIEVYGMDNENVAIYTADGWEGGLFPYLLLDYRGNLLIYTQDPGFDAKTAAEFFCSGNHENLSGKLDTVEKMAAYIPGKNALPTYLSRLNQTAPATDCHNEIRRLTAEDVPELYELLIGIEEFYTMKNSSREKGMADLLESMTHGGRKYGIFEQTPSGPRLVATAATSAENSISAMVVGVATHVDYRHKGYAGSLVNRLCRDCLNDGMKFLCLFYHNPEAGRIYQRIGFKELGQYAMLK